MSCSKSKLVVIEEMSTLIDFLEYENSVLEKEKNDLKIKYHGRPTEERNIMKDILTMHGEFDHDLAKLKEIVEDFSKIPPTKTQFTEITEEKIENVAKLQDTIIVYHEKVQNLLILKANYQMENESLRTEIARVAEERNKFLKLVSEIMSYEDLEAYRNKADLLNKECDRLTDLILVMEGEHNLSFNGIAANKVPKMSERKTEQQLRMIFEENQALENEIRNFGELVSKSYEEREMKNRILARKKEIEKLRERKIRVQKEVDELEKVEEEQADDYTKKMMILERIINKRPGSPSKNMTPRGNSNKKKSTFMEDIEVSLRKAKAISSPSPSNFN